MVEQEKKALDGVETALSGDKLDAVVCVAGGWAGGNASNKGKYTKLLYCSRTSA